MDHDRIQKRHIAIVGSGPSGFYAAEALLRSKQNLDVHVFEKLPVPFGLVRFGVAPDHPKLKKVTSVFDRIAKMSGFRFIGNVEVGKDISVELLSRHYNAIIFACGAEKEKNLGIPGEALKGAYSAREFVAWYNGHPHYKDLSVSLNHETAVIIGHGNVSLDVARILAKTPDELRRTDIARHALNVLSGSRIQRIHVIGRRGPVQAKFVSKELREFQALSICNPQIDPEHLRLGEECKKELGDASNLDARTNIQILDSFRRSENSSKQRQCFFDFLRAPIAINGQNSVESITLEKTKLGGSAFNQTAIGTNVFETLDCGLAIRCIGYVVTVIDGVPIDLDRGIFKNKAGRVCTEHRIIRGLYVTGWAKRGSTGTIGTNRGDSVATVNAVLQDLPTLSLDAPNMQLFEILKDSGIRPVSFEAWERIDSIERKLGIPNGAPRTKLTSRTELIKAAKTDAVVEQA